MEQILKVVYIGNQIKSIEFAYQYVSVINQEEFFQIKKLTES